MGGRHNTGPMEPAISTNATTNKIDKYIEIAIDLFDCFAAITTIWNIETHTQTATSRAQNNT